MDEFIRQLTHDNKLFQNQWNDINKRFQETSTSVGGKSILNALADYVIDEPQDLLSCPIRFVCVQNIIKRIVKENLSIPIDEVVQVFTRVLDGYVSGCWHLNFIETIYNEFNLAKCLCSLPPQTHLIELIFTSLQKKSFVNQIKDDDKKWQFFLVNNVFHNNSSSNLIRLNNKEVMKVMRRAYQELYRCAIKYRSISSVWLAIEISLKSVLLELFDDYDSLNDAEQDLSLYPDYPNHNYLHLLLSSFEKNSDLFKTNYVKLLETVERLILIGKFIDASMWMDRVISKQLISVDISPLLHTFIRICSSLTNSMDVEPRNLLCSKILYYLTCKLRDIKANKSVASLFFDLMIGILKLFVIDAPQCVQHMIVKTEFYPWKDFGSRINELISICISYDKIVQKSYFSNLSDLEKIVKVIDERAKINPVILQSTHSIALEAILRWSNKDAKYSIHVYKMCRSMLNLIDQHQINVEICSKFLDALQNRIYANDNDDQEEFFNHIGNFLFMPMSERLFTFLEQLKIVPHDIHKQLSSLILSALDRPLRTENGLPTLQYFTIRNLWSKIGSILIKEDDASLYLTGLDRMYTLAHDEDDKYVRYWWVNFWINIGMKLPQLAANRIEQLLIITIDRKDFTCLSLLPVLYTPRQEPFHARLDDIVNELFVDNAKHLYSLAYILWMISKEHPELITAIHLKHIFSSIDDISSQNSGILFQSVPPVANYQPHLFDLYHSQLLRRINEQQDILAYLCFQQYLIASAVIDGEQTAKKNVKILIDILKNEGTLNQIQSYIFYGLQLIGIKYKHALDDQRNDLIPFQSNPTCRSLLDYIDGHKMTEENQAAIQRAQDEMGLIEKRVIKTEQDVQQVTESVKEQEINTTDIRTRVDMVDTRLTDVTEQIEKQGREIERIDAKSLSYVPGWGRQVSKLLNHQSNNDWRLLGKRFGYSSSELKHWAMQSDPSMALLNEWYMTHKTDEATYGLLKMLKKIDRHDVEDIIQQAIIATGEIIPDDLPDEIKRLPPVFLSYQWGSQT